MSSGKKILESLKRQSRISTIPWKDLVSLMSYLEYEVLPAKKGGSGYKFHNPQTNALILLHRPHPSNEICDGAVVSVLDHLKEQGYI